MMNTYYKLHVDVLHDEQLMERVERVIKSVNSEEQLPALRNYCELAKKRMRVKLISNHHIDMMYMLARGRFMRDGKGLM